jgi:hypothetical protein
MAAHLSGAIAAALLAISCAAPPAMPAEAPPPPAVASARGYGRLDPAIIQRILRQNRGRFRRCYEDGLRASPNLQSRVVVFFVIDRNGAVSHAHDAGSDLPDSGTIGCIVRAVYGLSFPAPEGGVVTVSYPFLFSPGGD